MNSRFPWSGSAPWRRYGPSRRIHNWRAASIVRSCRCGVWGGSTASSWPASSGCYRCNAHPNSPKIRWPPSCWRLPRAPSVSCRPYARALPSTPCAPARNGLTRLSWLVCSGSHLQPAIHSALVMSEQGLSGQLLPRHVKPQSDELLSSWLTRVSLAHGLQPRTFGSILWPAKASWTGDIDRRATPEMLSILAQKTATSPRQALATTLRAYEG